MLQNLGPFEFLSFLLIFFAIPCGIVYAIYKAASKPLKIPEGPLSDADRMMHYDALKKSPGVIYALWLFLGWIGAHRFLCGRIGSGFGMLALWFLSSIFLLVGIGLVGLMILGVWWIVDLFLIGGWVRKFNEDLIAKLGMQRAQPAPAIA